ncbi:hypothetical protein MTO96_029761, partial [Rhipicephalus appendiculatus]
MSKAESEFWYSELVLGRSGAQQHAGIHRKLESCQAVDLSYPHQPAIHGTQSASPPPLEPDEYNMSHRRRGKCIIFNYKKIQCQPGRTGTDVDADNLQYYFGNLDFETVRYNDLSHKKTLETLTTLGKDDYSDDDCFVCCFLTHGDSDKLWATDRKFPVGEIVKPFYSDDCPSLLGKPKLFFIQACRGSRLDSGTEAVVDTADSRTPAFFIPTHADILVAYSTAPDFAAVRNPLLGSWFIQALCPVLADRAHIAHVLSMLTVVCRRVALDYEFYSPGQPPHVRPEAGSLHHLHTDPAGVLQEKT